MSKRKNLKPKGVSDEEGQHFTVIPECRLRGLALASDTAVDTGWSGYAPEAVTKHFVNRGLSLDPWE